MNWIENASIGTMTVALLVAFFGLGWIILKLCDLWVALMAMWHRWRAECEEPPDVDFAQRDTVPPEQWTATPWPFPLPAPPPEPAPPPYAGPPRRLTVRCTGNCNQGRACVCRATPPC